LTDYYLTDKGITENRKLLFVLYLKYTNYYAKIHWFYCY